MSVARWLAAVVILVEVASPQEARVGYDRWTAWSACGEGSTITYEIDLGHSKKYQRRLTLAKKTPESITIRHYQEAPSDKVTETDITFGPKDIIERKEAFNSKCPQCGNHKRGEVKEGKEKIKIRDTEYECSWTEVTRLDCDGKSKAGVNKVWYSKEVPGWVVQFEDQIYKNGEATPFADSKYTCVSFVKK